MSWICTCLLTNVNANTQCADFNCRKQRPASQNEDEFDLLLQDVKRYRKYKEHDINISEFNYYYRRKDGEAVTPEEQLFADLFNHETKLVCDMDTLTLRAHIEELSKIAKEAKVRYYAASEEDKKRKKTSNDNKPTGFARNLNIDEVASDALNAIKGRRDKLTKMEKIRKNLIEMGMDPADADKIMSAKNFAGS